MKSFIFTIVLVSLFATGQVAHCRFQLPHHHHHHHSHGHHHRHHAYPDFFHSQKRMFVFGDSYADTGNSKVSEESWETPYGTTFPGHPSGRYSDGLILTDLLARHFGVIGLGPIPYQQWRVLSGRPVLYFGSLLFGMNFAHGGTGVFDTEVAAPNMTAQIDLFEQVVNKNYGGIGLENSIALVTNSGNDYTEYLVKHNGILNVSDVMDFIDKTTSQLAANLKRIHDLGVKKIAVANLEALNCVPRVTEAYSFKKCDGDTIPLLVNFHNMDLNDRVTELNQGSKSNNTFVVLDLDQAFIDVLQGEDYKSRFPEPLKGCCMGTTAEGYCAMVDKQWKPMYSVCEDPRKSFFWDMVHPTQAGWEAVYERLLPTLKLLLE